MKPFCMYIDKEARGAAPLPPSAECRLIGAGKTIWPSFPGCELTADDRIFSEHYDFHLCFHKDLPQFSFYPVPELLIFAIDSYGGSFVSTNPAAVSWDPLPADVYYLDCKQKAHWLAGSRLDLLSLLVFDADWKNALGVFDFPLPKPTEKARSFLIHRYQLSPLSKKRTAPETEILIFPSLAAAKEMLPFVSDQEP